MESPECRAAFVAGRVLDPTTLIDEEGNTLLHNAKTEKDAGPDGEEKAPEKAKGLHTAEEEAVGTVDWEAYKWYGKQVTMPLIFGLLAFTALQVYLPVGGI